MRIILRLILGIVSAFALVLRFYILFHNLRAFLLAICLLKFQISFKNFKFIIKNVQFCIKNDAVLQNGLIFFEK